MNRGEAQLRGDLEAIWTRLAADAGEEVGFRSANLPVKGEEIELRLALGADGRRLLLPVKRGDEASVKEDRRNSAIALLRRPLDIDGDRYLFADLVCLRSELATVFTALCADILLRQEAFGGPPLSHAVKALSEWRALFAGGGKQLTLQQLAGLFGELNLLVRLLENDGTAGRFWVGPDQHRHDFVWPGTALEAKTTIAAQGRSVRVHGIDQLEPPKGADLFLVFQRLESLPAGGTTLPALVERACSLGHAATILGKLELVGYRADDAERYGRVTFHQLEEVWFSVDDAMPRLVKGAFKDDALPEGIDEIHYTLDLARAAPLHDTDRIRAVVTGVGELA